MYNHFCNQAYEINHLSTKIAVLLSLFYHHSITIYVYYQNKIFITTAEFNGLSSVAYENEILHFEWKILENITQCNLLSHG